MTTRVVPFAERHLPRPLPAVDLADAVTEPQIPLEESAAKPKRGKPGKCPQCGAGADQRVVSGLGAVQSVTCQKCGFEFPPKESV